LELLAVQPFSISATCDYLIMSRVLVYSILLSAANCSSNSIPPQLTTPQFYDPGCARFTTMFTHGTRNVGFTVVFHGRTSTSMGILTRTLHRARKLVRFHPPAIYLDSEPHSRHLVPELRRNAMRKQSRAVPLSAEKLHSPK
jgi:hypothetical protein